MQPVSNIEAAFARAWPPIETLEAGHWRAGFSRGLTRRANAIQCYDVTDDADPASRLSGLADAYRTRGLVPTFRVTPLTGPATYSALVGSGWARAEQSLVLTRDDLAHTNGISGAVRVTAPDDPWFLGAQASLQGYGAEEDEIFAAIISGFTAPAVGLTLLDDDDKPLASLIAEVADGVGVFLNVVVDPTRRRAGLGRKIMDAGLSWVAENGASIAALQVAAHNSAGIGLYLGLGFTYRYPYHYRRLEGSQAQ